MSEEADYPYYHNMGPRDGRNLIYEGLKRGKQFGFVASTDHHAGFPGSYGDGMAAVWAEGKTKESIWGALKAGRTYAVTGDRIHCQFDINGIPMGGKTEGSKRVLHWNVKTEYGLDKIVVYKNGKPIYVENGELHKKIFPEGAIKSGLRWDGESRIYIAGLETGRYRGKHCIITPIFSGKKCAGTVSG